MKAKRSITLSQARARLRKEHPNRYQMVKCEITTCKKGSEERRCTVYLDPSIMFTAPTFEEAFAKLEEGLTK